MLLSPLSRPAVDTPSDRPFKAGFRALLLACGLLLSVVAAQAQELIKNGFFDNTTTNWTTGTGCTKTEATNGEPIYGGNNSANIVAEVDGESCFFQNVCVFPGYSYVFSMTASRRTAAVDCTGPIPTTMQLKIIGLNAAGNQVGLPLVDMTVSRSNTVFAMTPVTGIPVISIPSNSAIVRVQVFFKDANPSFNTCGMVIDTISLKPLGGPGTGAGPFITPTTVCVNTSTVMSLGNPPAGANVSYSWTFGSATSGAVPLVSITPTTSVTWATTGNKAVSVSLDNGTCTLANPVTATVSVVNTFPNPTVTTPVSLCQNSTAAPLTATGTFLKWYTAATGGTGSATAPTPSTTTVGTTPYYVTQSGSSSGSCESGRAQINVTIKPASPAPTVNPVSYCQGAPASPLTATGSNLMWYAAATGGTGSATAPTPSTATVGTTTYYVTQTSNGCESARTGLAVTITTGSAAPGVSNVSYCQNSTAAPLTATGTNLKWYAAATGGTGSTTAPTPSTATAGTTDYFVTQTPSAGCESPRARITVTVKPKPNPPAVNPVNYCSAANNPPPLTATGDAGSTLTWYQNAAGPATYPSAPTPSTSSNGARDYYVSQTVNGCESDRATITVTVGGAPNPPGVSPVSYCQNDTAMPLSANGSSLTWYAAATGGTGTTTAPVPSTAAAGTAKYYVSQTVGCESLRDSILVTVKPTPAAPTVNGPFSYCQFETAAPLTSSCGASSLWYATATGGTGSSAAPQVSTATAGTNRYYAACLQNGCASTRSAVSVTVKPRPDTPVTATPLRLCQQSAATALPVTGTSLTWYPTQTAATGSPDTPTISTATPHDTTYYVTQTVNGCESDRTPVRVIVSPKPAAPTPTPAMVKYCQNETTQPLAVTGQNLLWYSQATGGGSTSATPSISTLVPNSSTYFVSQTQDGCESDRATVNIRVYALPAPPTVTTPQTYCGSATGTLTATGQSLKWYDDSLSGSVGRTNAPGLSSLGTGSYRYFVSQSDANCESRRARIDVNIRTVPQRPHIIVPPDYCQGRTAQPLAATAGAATDTVRWYSFSLNGTSSPTAPTPNTGTPGFYRFWAVSKNGCTSPLDSVTVNVKPRSPNLTTTTPSYSYCQGDQPIPVGVNAVPGYYTFTASDGNTTLVPRTGVPGTVTYAFVCDTNGCAGDTLKIPVETRPTPAPPSDVHPEQLCQNAPQVTLSPSGLNYLWYTVATGGTGVNTPPTPSTAVVTTYHYFVSQTDRGCESARVPKDVFVVRNPIANITPSRTSVCQFGLDSFLYSNISSSVITLSWRTDPALTVLGATDQRRLIVSADSEGRYAVYLRITEGGCQSPEVKQLIDVTVAPKLSILSDSEVCLNVPSRFLINTEGAVLQNYRWNFAGGSVVLGDDDGPYLIQWPAPGLYKVSVQASNLECPSGLAYNTVRVKPAPSARIAYTLGDPVLCTGDTLAFVAAQIQDSSRYRYTWTPERAFPNADRGSDHALGVIDQSGYIRLTVENEYHCMASDSTLIQAAPCCKVELPNAFSPNNDNRNDYFGFLTDGHHKISTFRIMNRWGQVVFETADEQHKWDGTLNGVPQSVGTYFYYVRYQCSDRNFYEMKGEITLVR